MTPEDINIIDRIVSGELTDQERSEHLRRFDSETPECWSVLALAFVEKQILRETFAEMNEPIVAPSKNRLWLISGASAALLIGGMLLGTLLTTKPGANSVTPVAGSVVSSEPVFEPTTAYVSTHLENGDQLVLPISYFQTH